MSKVRLLLDCGVVPVVVFDGDRLPAKQEEESARSRHKLQSWLYLPEGEFKLIWIYLLQKPQGEPGQGACIRGGRQQFRGI